MRETYLESSLLIGVASIAFGASGLVHAPGALLMVATVCVLAIAYMAFNDRALSDGKLAAVLAVDAFIVALNATCLIAMWCIRRQFAQVPQEPRSDDGVVDVI